MAVLLIAELSNSELAEDATAKALTAAKKMGDVTILCAGENTENAAKSAAKLSGVAKVLYAESPYLGHDLAEPLSDLIISIALQQQTTCSWKKDLRPNNASSLLRRQNH